MEKRKRIFCVVEPQPIALDKYEEEFVLVDGPEEAALVDDKNREGRHYNPVLMVKRQRLAYLAEQGEAHEHLMPDTLGAIKRWLERREWQKRSLEYEMEGYQKQADQLEEDECGCE